MEFVDNTGHIFSLPSYNEKPIGYEYDEYSYVFWIDSNNTSKLSVNNFYSRPIYALYELNKNFNCEDLSDDLNPIIDIEIYMQDSNVFKLISSKDLQHSISNKDFKLTDYIDLNLFEKKNNKFVEKYNFIKDKLTNEDLYCVRTNEVLFANQNDIKGTAINYLMIPIYPIAMSKEAGTWITNLMIHIYNSSTNKDEWCYISVGGEFVDEYEELIINGKNMGVSLPKDILKAVYSESLYNDEYNEALFNEKMKEYMLNYMNIKGETGNFKSAIDSLKWFGYGNKISVSKLLRTDNEFKEQYILDYFDISYDILESFKTFKASALMSIMIMLNKEKDEQWLFDNADIKTLYGGFLGENKPKMLSLIDNYEKIKIGNHDMPIEDDKEKYWYWKPYFDFLFNELGVKLVCLAYYYKKYFLPIHLNIHAASLGYRVFINDIKFTNTVGYSITYPSIMLNNKNEVRFIGNGIHYFTKQIHFIDDYFNEFQMSSNMFDKYLNTESLDLFKIDDTCVNIPIEFINNDLNDGYYNCVLLLKKKANNETIFESHFSFLQSDENKYKNFIIYPKKLNINIISEGDDVRRETRFIEYWIDNDFVIYLLVNNKWYEYNFQLRIHNPLLDFGTLKYRYYYNDHNYLFGKILNNKISNNHNIIMCGANDISKIRNISIGNIENDLYRLFTYYTLSDLPDGYIAGIIDNNIFGDNEYSLYWDTDNDNNIFYVIYKFNEYGELNIENDATIFKKDSYVTFKKLQSDNEYSNKSLIIYPEEWGTPKLIINQLEVINQFIWDELNLNYNTSYIESFNLENEEYIYQYFKQNYNLLSPFKQISNIDLNNNIISFNAYIHNKQLVDVNEINFDVNMYDILHYHLEHNLIYIDGTLIDNEFYQYIIFKDLRGIEYEIYIHKDLLGQPITFFPQNLSNDKKTLLCAYNGTIFMLNEFQDEDREYNYVILNVDDIRKNDINIINDNSNWSLFETEDEDGYIAYDTVDLLYDLVNNCYYNEDNGVRTNYMIYDKLYKNTSYVNDRYLSLVNLPNNLKYKNSIHLFDLYTAEIKEYNILMFHNDINMYIDGLNFTHGKNLKNTDEELKIYVNGLLDSFVDSRYPDIYGLYWSTPFFDGYKPLLPTELTSFIDKFGIYVKRNYRKIFNAPDDMNVPSMWELENLYQYDTKEFSYFKDNKDICIGNVYYRTLEDFYNNIYISKELIPEYEDIEIFLKDIEDNDHKYCFYDKEVRNINNLKEYFINELFYEVHFLDDNDIVIEDISLNKISNKQYNKVKITFYYNKSHIVRNRFYMISDYISMLTKDGYDVVYNITKEDDKYYLNIRIDDTLYKIELVEYKLKYLYMDNEYDHLISNQNPSMYWYDFDNGQLESLPSYLNELERFVYNEKDDFQTFLNNMDAYIDKYYQSKRYADDNYEARYTYSNYLVKDLTGVRGNIRIELATSFNNENNLSRLCVEVIDENNNIYTYSKLGSTFTLTGNEKQVKAYIQFVKNIRNYNNDWIIPKLIKIIETENRVKYDPEQCGSDIITVKYLNKEFKYGDNKNEYVCNLYNDFFKLKFNVYDAYLQNNNINMNLLHSVYEYVNELRLDTYLNYDFYLMHDDQYWYGLYISQETCDNIRTNSDLKIGDNLKKSFTNNNGVKYVLNYVRSSEEYLLNRLEFNTSDGYNQFKDDDIVCCYLHNNDRLPFNASISSKWKIEPMSLGMTLGTTFESNGEMTILSLPKNDSKYEHGYYRVTVKYSLDRDIQHQFKYQGTLRIS